jgi:peptide/nickel transport system permease protein
MNNPNISTRLETFYKIRKNKKLSISFFMVIILIVIAIIGPFFIPYEYEEMNTGPRLTPPNREHPLGTDQFGRDLLSRVVQGARYSLIISFLVVIFSNIIGITIGSVSGYLGGRSDIFLMRIIDIIFTVPWVLIAMVVAISIGRGIQTVIIALSIIYAPQIARVVRGTTLSLKEKEFVQAGKISGENGFSILFKYILPNSFGPIIVQSTMILAYALLAEAALSYIGYGVKPPIPSWGLLLQDAAQYYISYPYLVYFPGVAIIYTVLTFSFLGDGLRDLLDPKFKPL